MTDIADVLLTAYDDRLRGVFPNPAAGVVHERDGPLLRIVGRTRGLIVAPRDVGPRGGELERLVLRQRDFFAVRGAPVEWRTHAHDLPGELTARLLSAGFVPGRQEAVLVAPVSEIAAASVEPPDDFIVRRVAENADLRRTGFRAVTTTVPYVWTPA